MNVVAVEMGDRPVVFSKARRFAPEGVKILAELLGHMQFADDGIVVLDWDNATNRQPEDAHSPVVFISAVKQVGERFLTVEVRLDVEDTFGKDELVPNDFINIISSMEDKMTSTIERSKE